MDKKGHPSRVFARDGADLLAQDKSVFTLLDIPGSRLHVGHSVKECLADRFLRGPRGCYGAVATGVKTL
jgi:hypothetical protein